MGTSQALVSEIATPAGTGRLHLFVAAEPHALLLLGHGAGGGVNAPDLASLTRAALTAGLTVGLVEQPYRVAGRRSPAPAARLDEAFIAVARAAAADAARNAGPAGAAGAAGAAGTAGTGGATQPAGIPLVVGGRSAGARVACRTAAATDAVAVVALAFPLHPPGRPDRSRLAELADVAEAEIPCLVVQGERDAFGTAAELDAQAPQGVRVVPAPGGDHSLRRGLDAGAVIDWVVGLLGRAVD